MRREHRGAESLCATGKDELRRVMGQPAECGGNRENDHAGREHVARPEDVAQPSGGDEQHGIDQAVAVQHPENLVQRRAQIIDEAGNRNVHDGEVEQGHEEPEREHGQCQPGRGRSTRFSHG